MRTVSGHFCDIREVERTARGNTGSCGCVVHADTGEHTPEDEVRKDPLRQEKKDTPFKELPLEHVGETLAELMDSQRTAIRLDCSCGLRGE